MTPTMSGQMIRETVPFLRRPALRRRAKTLAGMAVAAALALTQAGCEVLDAVIAASEQVAVQAPALVAPTVTTTGPSLRQRPGLQSLGAYYCPKLLGNQLGTIGCTLALGAAPPKSSLRFDFGLGVAIANPNNVPVPALDVLVALTLYPDDVKTTALGATCISLCTADNPGCTGAPRPDACTVTTGTVKTVDDFVGALPKLIDGIASGKALQELQKSSIPAGGDVKLDLVFSLGLDPALSVLQRTAMTWLELYVQGKELAIDVPVRVEGSVFFDIPGLGRIAVDWGPLAGTWRLDAKALLSAE